MLEVISRRFPVEIRMPEFYTYILLFILYLPNEVNKEMPTGMMMIQNVSLWSIQHLKQNGNSFSKSQISGGLLKFPW